MAVRQDSFELGTARVCGAIAAGFGCLALFGWALELPFLATFGEGRIPMAPSTAVLFVLYGIVALLRARHPLSRGALRVGVAVSSAGALVASLLLVLSSLEIRPAAELLGFAVAGSVAETPTGHMSPVTAALFLLASLSFLGSLPSSSSRRWRTRPCTGGAPLSVFAMAGVLLLAYLFGSPLFYGGSFIPPAATTSVAFGALGIALLGLARTEAGPAGTGVGPLGGVPYPLVLVLLGVGIVTAGGSYLRSSGTSLPRPGRRPALGGRGAEGERADPVEGGAAGRRFPVPGQRRLFRAGSATVRRPAGCGSASAAPGLADQGPDARFVRSGLPPERPGGRAAGRSRGPGSGLVLDREAHARGPAFGRAGLRGFLPERARRAGLPERPRPHRRRARPGAWHRRAQDRSGETPLSAHQSLARSGPHGRDAARPSRGERRSAPEPREAPDAQGARPAYSPGEPGRGRREGRAGPARDRGSQGLPRAAGDRRVAGGPRLPVGPGRPIGRRRGERADARAAMGDGGSRGRHAGRRGGGDGGRLARAARARAGAAGRGGAGARLAARRDRPQPQRGLRLRSRDAAVSLRKPGRLPQPRLLGGGARGAHPSRPQAGVHGRGVPRPAGTAPGCRAAGTRLRVHPPAQGRDHVSRRGPSSARGQRSSSRLPRDRQRHHRAPAGGRPASGS